jgi:hypothetical protein
MNTLYIEVGLEAAIIYFNYHYSMEWWRKVIRLEDLSEPFKMNA